MIEKAESEKGPFGLPGSDALRPAYTGRSVAPQVRGIQGGMLGALVPGVVVPISSGLDPGLFSRIPTGFLFGACGGWRRVRRTSPYLFGTAREDSRPTIPDGAFGAHACVLCPTFDQRRFGLMFPSFN